MKERKLVSIRKSGKTTDGLNLQPLEIQGAIADLKEEDQRAYKDGEKVDCRKVPTICPDDGS